MSTVAHVALGSNLASAAGDRLATIHAAFDRLDAAPGVKVDATSSVWEYPSVGGPPDAPAYLNAVARLTTTLEPFDLLRALRAIEDDLGRRRAPDRNAPRTLDLDLLLYGDAVIDVPGLAVPHPHMHDRRFVLEPLAEVSPRARHPTSDLSAADLLARVVEGRPVTDAEFLPVAVRHDPAGPAARLNAFDKGCAAFAAVVAVFLLLSGVGGLFFGSKAHFDLPPVAGALPAFAGWGILKSVFVAWQHSAPVAPVAPSGRGFPVRMIER